MAQVEIRVAGRAYELACRDGDEDHLRALGRVVDRRASEVAQGLGGLNEARLLLMTALVLADQSPDAPGDRSEPQPDAAATLALERLAERMESLADRLEA